MPPSCTRIVPIDIFYNIQCYSRVSGHSRPSPPRVVDLYVVINTLYNIVDTAVWRLLIVVCPYAGSRRREFRMEGLLVRRRRTEHQLRVRPVRRRRRETVAQLVEPHVHHTAHHQTGVARRRRRR